MTSVPKKKNRKMKGGRKEERDGRKSHKIMKMMG